VKAVILAGGYGSRMSEETTIRPKPMVEIGPRPILWHIMKIYAAHGINDFVVCLGYKGHVIKDFFANYSLLVEDVQCDLRAQTTTLISRRAEPWTVTLVETGENTQTGGRLKRVREHVGDETFCMTYGDGVCDVNVSDLVAFHRAQGGLATLTAVQPPGRFGYFSLPGNRAKVASFREKPQGDGAWVNGGFFVLEPGIFDYIEADDTRWEIEPLERLAAEGNLAAFRHPGFWQCMDHLRDKVDLDRLWNEGRAPWKVWE
jgi:glucose-1-phosphate cytidylyltransferase